MFSQTLPIAGHEVLFDLIHVSSKTTDFWGRLISEFNSLGSLYG